MTKITKGCVVACCALLCSSSAIPALSFRPEVSSDLGAAAPRRLHSTLVDVPPRQRPTVPRDAALDDELRRQAEGARYSFATSVVDGISDNTHTRQETRDGLRLAGLYSYSDGFFKHTVHYVADERGYRVLKDDVETIGDGPRVDPWGQASVSSNVGGVQNSYTISAADIKSLQRRFPLRTQPL